MQIRFHITRNHRPSFLRAEDNVRKTLMKRPGHGESMVFRVNRRVDLPNSF